MSKYLISQTQYPISKIKHQKSKNKHQTTNIQYPIPKKNNVNPTLHIKHS